jgi:hypothetical protein
MLICSPATLGRLVRVQKICRFASPKAQTQKIVCFRPYTIHTMLLDNLHYMTLILVTKTLTPHLHCFHLRC